MSRDSENDRICLVQLRRKTCFRMLGIFLSLCGTVLAAEVALRIFYPQDTLSPRWQFSPQYCSLPFPNAEMVHERPGQWRFIYRTNSHACRGPEARIANHYDRPSILVLGDSYSFGAGVDEGQEYAAVLRSKLGGQFGVVNLAVGGWGLTQEIRRFYEFGVLYNPSVVILQYSSNDPRDNLKCPVTRLEGDWLAFYDTDEGLYRIKNYLSRSFLQKSQLYNLLRNSVYLWFEARIVDRTRKTLSADATGAPTQAQDQVLYSDLLRQFVADLHQRGLRIVFLTVNGQLQESRLIHSVVMDLDRQGWLEFRDAAEWLGGSSGYASPEGHLWGAKAHRIIGLKLAELIANPPNPPVRAAPDDRGVQER